MPLKTRAGHADGDPGNLDLLAFLEGTDGDLLAELDLAVVTLFAFSSRELHVAELDQHP